MDSKLEGDSEKIRKVSKYQNFEGNDQYRAFDIKDLTICLNDLLEGVTEALPYVVRVAKDHPSILADCKALVSIQDKDVFAALLCHLPIDYYPKIAKAFYLSAFSTFFYAEDSFDNRRIRAINNLIIMCQLYPMNQITKREQLDERFLLTFYDASLGMDKDKILPMTDVTLKLFLKEVEMLLNTDLYLRECGVGKGVVVRNFSLRSFAEKRKDFYRSIVLHDAVKSHPGYQKLLVLANEMFKFYGFEPLIPEAPGLAASMSRWLENSSVVASAYASRYLPTSISTRFIRQTEIRGNQKDPIFELREKIDLALKEGRSVKKEKQELSRYYLDSKNWPKMSLEDVVKDYVLRGIRSAFFWILNSSDEEKIYEYIRFISPENIVRVFEIVRLFEADKEVGIKPATELTIGRIRQERFSQPSQDYLARKRLQYVRIDDNDQCHEFEAKQVPTYVDDWLQGIMEAQDYILQAANESPEPVILANYLKQLRSDKFDLLADLIMSNLDKIKNYKKVLIKAVLHQFDDIAALGLHVQRIVDMGLLEEVLGQPQSLNQYSQLLFDNNILSSIEDTDDFVRVLTHFPSVCYPKIAKSLYMPALVGPDENTKNSLMCKLMKTLEHYKSPANQQGPDKDKIVVEFYMASLKKDLDKLVSLLTTDVSRSIALTLLIKETTAISSEEKFLDELGRVVTLPLANENALKNTAKEREDFYRAIVSHASIKNHEIYSEVLSCVDDMFKRHGLKTVIPLSTRLVTYATSVALPTFSDLRTNLATSQVADTASHYLSTLSGMVARYRGTVQGGQAQQEPPTEEPKEGWRR